MKFCIIITVIFTMEALTWVIHKYVMHGFMLRLQRDHHYINNSGTLERNDYFSIMFAITAILLMYRGVLLHYNCIFFIGVGISLYGMAYFFVHDIFIHQRIPLLRNTKNPYLLATRPAYKHHHKHHHKHTGKHQGESFGFL